MGLVTLLRARCGKPYKANDDTQKKPIILNPYIPKPPNSKALKAAPDHPLVGTWLKAAGEPTGWCSVHKTKSSEPGRVESLKGLGLGA